MAWFGKIHRYCISSFAFLFGIDTYHVVGVAAEDGALLDAGDNGVLRGGVGQGGKRRDGRGKGGIGLEHFTELPAVQSPFFLQQIVQHL